MKHPALSATGKLKLMVDCGPNLQETRFRRLSLGRKAALSTACRGHRHIIARLAAAAGQSDTMLHSLNKRAPRSDATTSEPLFEPLRAEEHRTDVNDHWWQQYERSQRHNQRHLKLRNTACFVLGTVLGAAALLICQRAFSRSVDRESTEHGDSITPQCKSTVQTLHIETD